MKAKINNIALYKKIYNLIKTVQKGSCDRIVVGWTVKRKQNLM